MRNNWSKTSQTKCHAMHQTVRCFPDKCAPKNPVVTATHKTSTLTSTVSKTTRYSLHSQIGSRSRREYLEEVVVRGKDSSNKSY